MRTVAAKRVLLCSLVRHESRTVAWNQTPFASNPCPGINAARASGGIVLSEAVAAIEAAGGLVLYDRERGPDGQYNLGATLTDAGLAHIKGLTHLKHLDLQDTEVTDSGLVHLKGLTGLRELDLSRTMVTDVGLVHLGRLTELRTLSLDNTMIGAAGAQHLVTLTKLRSLDLARTRVDDFVAQDLRRALPKAKIIFTPFAIHSVLRALASLPRRVSAEICLTPIDRRTD